MADDQDAARPDAAAQPDGVIPPPPAGGQPWAPGETVPLAPPLGAPVSSAAAPQPPQPGYPQPGHPQADFAQPGYPQTAYPQPAGVDPSAYPISSVAPPPARSSTRSTGIVLGIVGGVVALAVVGIAVAVGLFLATPTTRPVAVPSPTVSPFVPPAGPSDAPEGTDPDAAAGDEIADVLQAKMDEYKRLRDSGALWQSIPDTEYNRTALTAFLYFLTDMKVATIWGVDAATADEYRERMAMLEEKLLAQQPLGDDIQIVLEEGRVFRYDGDTGEGGYFTE